MPKKSSKENKPLFFERREELGLTREQASNLMDNYISSDRLEKLENERLEIYPDEIVKMSKAYKSPELLNYYCSHMCPIGKDYIPEVKIKDLSSIILKMIDSLNEVQDNQRRLVKITSDEEVNDDELKEFVYLQNELSKISLTIDALEIWVNQQIIEGKIDADRYNELLQELK